MKYKLAIFDLDGTILETLEDLKNSVNFALANNNLPMRSLEDVKSFVGNGIRKLIERAVPNSCPDMLKECVFADFNEHYATHCKDTTKPYDGIVDMLRELKNISVKCAVVSNKSDSAVQPLCNHYYPGIFDIAVGVKEGIRPKPNPDSVRSVIEQLSVSKAETVYIGDSDVDVQTAKNVGVECIAVLWGFRDKDMLLLAGATKFAANAKELMSYFNE